MEGNQTPSLLHHVRERAAEGEDGRAVHDGCARVIVFMGRDRYIYTHYN